jgi:hypothetical protein
MKKYLALIPFLLLASLCARANQSASGWCMTGAQNVLTNGLASSNLVQASYPSCTVTVTDAVLGTLVTIFRDNSGTPLSNPFLATTIGQWQFYAANGRYTVTLSNLVTPTGAIAPPVSIPDIILFDCTVANACSGGTIGALTASPSPLIPGLPTIATAAATVASLPEYADASLQTAADPCAQINANWLYLATNVSAIGGVNDARAFSGTPACAASPLSNDPNLGGTLLLGGVQLQAASPWIAENGILIRGGSAHPVSSPVGTPRGSTIQAASSFPANSTLFQVGTSTANTGSVVLEHLRLSMYPLGGPGVPNPVGGTVYSNQSGQEGTSLHDVFLDGGCAFDFSMGTSQAQNMGPLVGVTAGMNGCNSTSSVNFQFGISGTSQTIANLSAIQLSSGGTSNLALQQNCITIDFLVNLWLESGHCEEATVGIEIGGAHLAHNVAISNWGFSATAAKPMTSAIDLAPNNDTNILLTNISAPASNLTNIVNDRSTTNPCTIAATGESGLLGWYWRSATSIFTSSPQCPDIFPAHNENFSASTLKIPTSAGCTASLSSMLCYDSTAGNTHVLAGGTDTVITQSIPGVKIASLFSGADWCARVSNASSALAGPGEIWVSQLAGTSACSAAPVIASNQTIRFIQPGTYHIGVGWTISNLVAYGIIGPPGTTIQFDGTAGLSLIGSGLANGGTNVRIDGVIFSGNSSVTNAITLTQIDRSTFIDMQGRNCSGVALVLNGSLLNTFIRFKSSSNDASFTTTPAGGIYLTVSSAITSNNNLFLGTVVEGVAGPGVEINAGTSNTFQNGTFEGETGANGWGAKLDTGSYVGNLFSAVDFESNAAGDISNQGLQTVLDNVSCNTMSNLTPGTMQMRGNTCPVLTNTGSLILYPTTAISTPAGLGTALLDTGFQTMTNKVTERIRQTAANTFAGNIALVGGTATVTFSTAFVNTPSCTATDNTSVEAVKAAPTASTLTLTGTGTDEISWMCIADPQ